MSLNELEFTKAIMELVMSIRIPIPMMLDGKNEIMLAPFDYEKAKAVTTRVLELAKTHTKQD